MIDKFQEVYFLFLFIYGMETATNLDQKISTADAKISKYF
jgi:hypothetical protein